MLKNSWWNSVYLKHIKNRTAKPFKLQKNLNQFWSSSKLKHIKSIVKEDQQLLAKQTSLSELFQQNTKKANPSLRQCTGLLRKDPSPHLYVDQIIIVILLLLSKGWALEKKVFHKKQIWTRPRKRTCCSQLAGRDEEKMALWELSPLLGRSWKEDKLNKEAGRERGLVEAYK